MKLRLCVDYDQGSTVYEGVDPADFTNTATLVCLVAAEADDYEVSVPDGGRGCVRMRVGQIDRIDLTWEA